MGEPPFPNRNSGATTRVCPYIGMKWGTVWGDGKGLVVRRRDSSATPRNDMGSKWGNDMGGVVGVGGGGTAGQPQGLPLQVGGFAGDKGWGGWGLGGWGDSGGDWLGLGVLGWDWGWGWGDSVLTKGGIGSISVAGFAGAAAGGSARGGICGRQGETDSR